MGIVSTSWEFHGVAAGEDGARIGAGEESVGISGRKEEQRCCSAPWIQTTIGWPDQDSIWWLNKRRRR
jgi:hypothetical protein